MCECLNARSIVNKKNELNIMNVRDKVGSRKPNGYFSSVFTREDIRSLPVPGAKFQEAKSGYLGQLIVTPEMVAKKIKSIKNNKS